MLEKNVHQQVEIFNKTLLSIFHNYITNTFILCDYKDLTWINEEINSLIRGKHSLYQSNRKPGRLCIFKCSYTRYIKCYKIFQIEIPWTKWPKTTLKTYWAILKAFVNDSKIPLTPPLLVDNKLVTDLLDKGNLFNKCFAKQCPPISNHSTVRVSINFETTEKHLSLEFCVDYIIKIIWSLDQNKGHSHDEISIRNTYDKTVKPQQRNHYIWFSETVLKLSHSPKNGKKQA